MPEHSSPQTLLFLSDAHLGGFSVEKNNKLEQEIVNLVDFCLQKKIKIFILGDFFDYWMEYHGYVPDLARKVRQKFEQYNNTVGPTLYITGNHDNWTRSYFEEIGFVMESGFRIIQIDGFELLILHGDGLPDTRGDVHRPLLHRFLRNKKFIEWYQKILPPQLGLGTMKWFSRFNRLLGSYREDVSKLNSWAEQMLKNTGNDFIICGHDHFPRKNCYDFGTYLNLGTFYKHKSLGIYNKHQLDLVVWDDASRQLNNYYTDERFKL